jgi:hypothetical protein
VGLLKGSGEIFPNGTTCEVFFEFVCGQCKKDEAGCPTKEALEDAYWDRSLFPTDKVYRDTDGKWMCEDFEKREGE